MATDVMQRAAQMFPTLTAAQVDRISSIGRRRAGRAGGGVVEGGARRPRGVGVGFGAPDVPRPIGEGEDRVAKHGPGQCTGEINMLSARRSIVRTRAVSDGEVIEVDRNDLRTLVKRDAELSEVLMRAFILRRVALAS